MNISQITEQIKSIFPAIKDFFEVIGVIIITIGSFYAIYKYIQDLILKKPNAFIRFKLGLGQAIVSGLELTVVADVINTTIDVNYNKLGMLLILVIIRTMISYFLNKDLEEAPTNIAKSLK